MRGQNILSSILLEEIKERGWSLIIAAEKCGIPRSEFVGLLIGRTKITKGLSAGLARGLETSSEIWMNLEKKEAEIREIIGDIKDLDS